MAAALLWTVAAVLAVQWAYAAQFGAEDGAVFNVPGVPSWINASPLYFGATVFVLAALGGLSAHYAIRAQTLLTAMRSNTTRTAGGSR
jgi:branched-chain amino acid transport system permease protein